MLRQWVDRDQRLERLRPLPAIRQLVGVQRCPFAHESQRAGWQRPVEDLQAPSSIWATYSPYWAWKCGGG
jgi:hypothetical protein